MTREEAAIKTLKENLCGLCTYGSQSMESCDIRSCDNRDAIKALNQESIIDKIRAEIEQKCCITVARENDPAITLYDVFKIIDKYRTESEE